MFWGKKKSDQESGEAEPKQVGVTSQLASAPTDTKEHRPAEAPPAEPSGAVKFKPTALEFGMTERNGANLLTGVCSIGGEGGPALGACEWKVTKSKDRRPTAQYRILF